MLLWVITRLFNAIFDPFIGGARRPVTFAPAEVNPGLATLDAHYAEIRREIEPVLADREAIPRYHDLDPMQTDISGAGDPGKRWQVLMLNCMGRRIDRNCLLCPVTAKLVEAVPDLFQAFFSILEPGKSVPAHSGIYRGYLRYHLGLVVPKARPPRIRVKDQFHEWSEGRSFVFDDTWEHQVYNEAEEIRVVLIVDVLRPMPALPHVLNRCMKAWLRVHYARLMLRQPYFE